MSPAGGDRGWTHCNENSKILWVDLGVMLQPQGDSYRYLSMKYLAVLFVLILFVPVKGQMKSDAELFKVIETRKYSEILAYVFNTKGYESARYYTFETKDSALCSVIRIYFGDSSYAYDALRNGDSVLKFQFRKMAGKLEIIASDFWDTATTRLAMRELEGSAQMERIKRMEYVYGKNCGFTGEDPPYRIKLNELVERKDTIALENWLIALQPELHAYAVEGFYKLRLGGYVLTQKQKGLIKSVKENKYGMVTVCHGCVYSSDFLQSVVEEFTF